MPFDDLRPLLMGLLTRGERAKVRFFVRRTCSIVWRDCSWLCPRTATQYSRQTSRGLFLDRFNGESVDFNLSLEADEIAHLHFKVWVDEGQVPDVAFDELQSEVGEITRSWAEKSWRRAVATTRCRQGAGPGSELGGVFP